MIKKIRKKTKLIFNGSFGKEFELPKIEGVSYKSSQDGKNTYTDITARFSYSFNFICSEPLHHFRDSLPVKNKNKEVIELYKFLFEKELKKYLNKKPIKNFKT
jgi:hypothetical protein